MNPRWHAAAIILGVITAVGAVWWLTSFFGPPSRMQAPPISELAPDAQTAEDLARLSCVHVRLANQAVQADAPANNVREGLAAARALAAEALLRDPRFTGLSGGIAALDEAIRNDDGAAAAVGLLVALRECELLSG